MRIVFLDNTLDGNLFGGAQTFLYNILRGLKQRDIEVHIVTSGIPSAITAQNIANAGAIFHNTIWPRYSLVEEAAPVLATWLNQLAPDVFVVSVSPDIGWVVLPYLSPNIATLAIGHNDSDTFYEPARHYASFLTGAIGVSNEIVNNYITKSGINKENVIWIPYGIKSIINESDIKNSDPGEPVTLIYAGRIEDYQKRASDLIKIIQQLVKRKIDFRFRIVGDGPLFAKLKEELTPWISTGIVQLTGWLKNSELLEQLCQSEIFILTSAYEGFCISLVEAMANGCCPVVTDIKSGNKQLVTDGKNGYIVHIGDIDDFVEKISGLAANPALLLTLRKAAYKEGHTYSIDRMIDNYIDCFKKMIEKGKRQLRQVNPDFPLMESCYSKYPKWVRKAKIFAKKYL